ncbi:hypothetical protein DEF23_04480 [Marinitenerispora sediminis]|nr:hypothetical protein DEF23_04480 [Marinitenerispora sediminis]
MNRPVGGRRRQSTGRGIRWSPRVVPFPIAAGQPAGGHPGTRGGSSVTDEQRDPGTDVIEPDAPVAEADDLDDLDDVDFDLDEVENKIAPLALA